MGELIAALDELQSAGMKDLVLDLQGNGGGMLNTAIAMGDEFLSGDRLICVYRRQVIPSGRPRGAAGGPF